MADTTAEHAFLAAHGVRLITIPAPAPEPPTFIDVTGWCRRADDGAASAAERARMWCDAQGRELPWSSRTREEWYHLRGLLAGYAHGYRSALHDAYMAVSDLDRP